MMMVFWLKLEELMLPLKPISNQLCPMFKYLTAIPLWELRFIFRGLVISSTSLREGSKPVVLNVMKWRLQQHLNWVLLTS